MAGLLLITATLLYEAPDDETTTAAFQDVPVASLDRANIKDGVVALSANTTAGPAASDTRLIFVGVVVMVATVTGEYHVDASDADARKNSTLFVLGSANTIAGLSVTRCASTLEPVFCVLLAVRTVTVAAADTPQTAAKRKGTRHIKTKPMYLSRNRRSL
jgi:hypothetical protein